MDPNPELDALLTSAKQARRQGNSGAAEQAYSQVVDAARDLVDRPRQAAALIGLAKLARERGDHSSALARYRDAAAIARLIPDTDRVAYAIRNAADALAATGRRDEAAFSYAEALEIYRANSKTDPVDLANAVRGFAIIKQIEGAREDALTLWREARDLYYAAGIEASAKESARRVALLESE